MIMTMEVLHVQNRGTKEICYWPRNYPEVRDGIMGDPSPSSFVHSSQVKYNYSL